MPTVEQQSAVSSQPSAVSARPPRPQVSEAVIHKVYGELQWAAGRDVGPRWAFMLAIRCGIGGNRESRRRIVRFAIEHLRREPIGARICANISGYWLACDGTEWEAYLESRKTGARFEFVRERKMREAARDATNRQGRLFE